MHSWESSLQDDEIRQIKIWLRNSPRLFQLSKKRIFHFSPLQTEGEKISRIKAAHKYSYDKVMMIFPANCFLFKEYELQLWASRLFI